VLNVAGRLLANAVTAHLRPEAWEPTQGVAVGAPDILRL
jgi:hypothetical protein